MTTEQILIDKWRALSPDKQEAVLTFVEQVSQPTKDSPMGLKLRAIRQQIVEAGIPLLNEAELAQEIATRRGGVEAPEV
jgi:hypothetical protein